jgi:hypothetical protein
MRVILVVYLLLQVVIFAAGFMFSGVTIEKGFWI